MNVSEILDMQRTLADIGQRLSAYLARAGHSVTLEQALLVAALPARPETVGALMGRCYAGTNVSYNLTKLERMGMVERRTNDVDGRKKLVARTANGEALADLVRGFLDKERLETVHG